MKRLFLVVVSLLLLGLPAFGQNERVLVKFRPGVDAGPVYSRLGLVDEGGIPQIRVRFVRGNLEALKRAPEVEWAEPDGIGHILVVPNDPLYPNQWAPPKINAPQAWDYTLGNPGGLIAIIDTGVDYTNLDLAGKVVLGPDYYNGDDDPIDDHGHGTRMASIAGSYSNNGVGAAGLDWVADILAIKVCGATGSCWLSAVASGVVYAADRGAKASNLSLGGFPDSSTLRDALKYAWDRGALLACAAGNSNSSGAVYPADYEECIKVGATDSNDQKASFSNWGPKLEVMAPGVGIVTSGGTSTGTSPAAPHVAGLASLLFGFNPNLDNCVAREIIRDSAVDLGTVGWDELYGYGRIDALAAVLASMGRGPSCQAPPPPPPADTVPPEVSITSPADGAAVSGRVTISADAADNVGVVSVEFFVDGTRIGQDNSFPYSIIWNTKPKKWTAGSHAIRAVAADAAGNVGTTQVSVNLQK